MTKCKTIFTARANIYVALVISTLSFVQCTNKIDKKKLSAIKLFVNYPVVYSSDKIDSLKDTVSIFYYDKYALYQLPYTESLEDDKKIIGIQKKYTFFIYDTTQKKGVLYKSVSDTTKGLSLPVDSFLFKRAYASTFDNKDLELVDKVVDKKAKVMLEKYIFPKQYQNENTFDTIFYYFNNSLQQINYSFFKRINEGKSLKLYKIKILYNEKKLGGNNQIIPQREFIFELKRMQAPKEVKSIFLKFVEKLKTS